MKNLRPFIDDLIFNMDSIADHGMAQHHTMLHYRTLPNGHTAANDRIFHGSADDTAIGDHGIRHLCALEIMHRTGVCRLRVYRPLCIHKIGGYIIVQQVHIRIKIAFDVIDRCHIASLVLNAANVQLVILRVQDIRQIVNG